MAYANLQAHEGEFFKAGKWCIETTDYIGVT